ncbi:hypothetical protein HDV04_000423 [Boothiomyces sp. JEL0838]|nr:hypothetical protein HDV04_000403 [Boothiomyces sp. JEL0838]KAJ3314461.1 hypothetical protein HDV04_000423 [Boothiomyces sp. JEL0838]
MMLLRRIPKRQLFLRYSTQAEPIVAEEAAQEIVQEAPVEEENNDPLQQYLEPKLRNFIKADKPFPMNPYFKPRPPLSNKTRQEIFDLYEEDSTKWTPRQLAEKFGISIVRVEAILRLKSLGKQMDTKITAPLVEGMEQMLGKASTESRLEPLKETVLAANKPFIQLLDEEKHLSPEDAAVLLKLKPQENFDKTLNKKFKVFEESAKPAPIDTDALKGGKHSFMITDTSSGQLFIREKNGDLRKASTSEVWLKRNGKPKGFAMGPR